MYQRGRLKRSFPMFAFESPVRDGTKLVVDQRNESVHDGPICTLSRFEQRGDL
jgi:hypothetical protein